MKKLTLIFLLTCGLSYSQTINVEIYDNGGYSLYSERLPLINVMHFREAYTTTNTEYIFHFEVPEGWNLTFESESISFSSVGSGKVILYWLPNSYYEFAITTVN